ncbi:MAG: phenylalanine--tRNA ligase subunit beta [Candidatus Rokubacteria bacterium]|nr:phenylalanine--tRNA ligase subunit beta [Candidatus Rokubacteria bacterium]
MKISYRWLTEYVETALSPQAIADRLVSGGLEVAEVQPLVIGLTGVVVGEVEAVERELGVTPSGHRLVLTRVTTGAARFSVVCGAPNVAAGGRAAFAAPGAALPGGRRIDVATIRGARSEGMLCSERELGIGDDADTILLLPADAPLGADLVSYLELDDWVLEVEVSPNRPDCLSVVGVAREVAALTGAPFRVPAVQVKEGEADAASLASVVVEDPDLCPRYAARIITGLSVAPSPARLAQRLRAVGLRPINNLVDVTNYVLWELGHPLHAFDYDTVAEHTIVVRRARPGERLATLDGQERQLTDSMLLIADPERAIGLAGVMGGANTEVTDRTGTVLLESAYFHPASIRRTARALGLATDAAYRFERGADIEGLREALDRAAQMMAEVGGGSVAKGLLDVSAARRPPRRVVLRLGRIQRVVGRCPPRARVTQILRDLGFAVDDRNSDLEVEVPSFRRDVSLEDDLVEEVIRVWGYGEIPSTLPSGSLSLVRRPPQLVQADRVRQVLVGAGLSEVITMSFADPERLKLLGWDPASADVLALRNPLSRERALLRPTLAAGLLELLAGNLHRQNPDVRCFEIGRVFTPGGPEGLAREALNLGIALMGARGARAWYQPREDVDLYDTKGLAEHVLAALRVDGCEARPPGPPFLEPGRGGELLVAGAAVGWFGEASLRVREAFDLPAPVLLAEVFLDRLLVLGAPPLRYAPLPRFPAVQRDLALVVAAEVQAADVTRAVHAMAEPLLRRVMLFDVYTGDQVAAGRKSLAFALVYQAEDRTLTDAEVNAVHARIVERLQQRLDAALRGSR